MGRQGLHVWGGQMPRIAGARVLTTLAQHRLSTLERQVIESARRGAALSAGGDLPKPAHDASRLISAEVVRDAVAGVHYPLHQRGLRLEGFEIDGDIDLSYLSWQGELTLKRCYVHGEIILDYARPVGRICFDHSHVRRVAAFGAAINGDFYMRDNFRATEGIYALGLTVTNALNMRRCFVTGPRDMPRRCAIEIFRAELGDFFLTHARIEGGVYAKRVSIKQNLRVYASDLRSRTAMGWDNQSADFNGAATFSSCDVKGTIYVTTQSTPNRLNLEGSLEFTGGSCKTLNIHPEEMAKIDLRIKGLTYAQLRGVTPAALLSYIENRTEFWPDAYAQLARYCGSVGDVAAQRQTLIKLERRVTRELPKLSHVHFVRRFYGALVGYGFRSLLAVPWLALCLTACIILVHFGGGFLSYHNSANSVRTFHGERIPWSMSAGISLDNLLPFASLGIKDQWIVAPETVQEWGLVSLFLTLKFSAWGLVALALASITGAIRKSY